MFHDKRVSNVVVGTVSDLRKGPDQPAFEGDTHPSHTSVLVVNVVKSLTGEAEVSGQVYVQLFGAWDPDATLKAIPRGTVAVVYGVPADPADSSFSENPTQGKPAGSLVAG